MEVMKLYLPFPPSLNSLYPGKVRRHKSTAYEAWIKEAGKVLNQQHTPAIKGLVEASYVFGKPDNRKRDLDNLFKAPNDLLVAHGIIEDDSHIQKISAQWGDIEGCEVELKRW